MSRKQIMAANIFQFMGKDDNKKKREEKDDKNDLIKIFNKLSKENIITTEENSNALNFCRSSSITRVKAFTDNILNLLDEETQLENLCLTNFPQYYNYNLNPGPKIREIDPTIFVQDMINELIEGGFEVSQEQSIGIAKVFKFICDETSHTFGLYGYAGTGKTTIVVKLIEYLLNGKYISSVVFSAPTNKAVNVLKSKFYGTINSNNPTQNIQFMSIHKLLNYMGETDTSGQKIFVKKGEGDLHKFDLVIIDEASMVEKKIVTDIFEDIERLGSNKVAWKNIIKIIFVGDPAQLPPVNEKNSIIFAKNKSELKTVKIDIASSILSQNYIVLNHIVRTKNNNIINLCQNIRGWIDNLNKPELQEFSGNGLHLYKYKKGTNKTESKWFKKYLKTLKNNEEVSNIILTWTNGRTNDYNSCIRNTLFAVSAEDNKFVIGDVLILSSYYNMDAKTPFYTSEQIKVVEMERIIKTCYPIKMDSKLHDPKNEFYLPHIYSKLDKTVTEINRIISGQYNAIKLSVIKLSDDRQTKNSKIDIYQIVTIGESSEKRLKADIKAGSDKINKLNDYYNKKYGGEDIIIKTLWKKFNEAIVEQFADVSHAFSITTHKAQGSGYYNVFVDVDDILNNYKNKDEAKRCMYTAMTRPSNELFLLI